MSSGHLLSFGAQVPFLFKRIQAMNEKKQLIKIANEVQDALMKLQNNRWLEVLTYLASFANQLKEITSASKKLGMSLTHSWFAAAQSCDSNISRSLNDLQYSIQRAKQLIEAPDTKLPKLSNLVEELVQLHAEFGSYDFDKAANTLSVETEPITLDGIYLGPFKIELQLEKLSNLYRESSYCCIALDPHPAATSDEVTHPHVSNERVCEGDGVVAIRTALEQGRLCDFFTMVSNILNTYNPDSPYIPLADWDGEPCYECGYVMDSENSYYCSYCDRSFCEECSTYCHSCDETICLGCAARCQVCEVLVCPGCAQTRCIECECVCCESCIEEGLCPDCKEGSENHENEEQEPDKTETSGINIGNEVDSEASRKQTTSIEI